MLPQDELFTSQQVCEFLKKNLTSDLIADLTQSGFRPIFPCRIKVELKVHIFKNAIIDIPQGYCITFQSLRS